MDLDGIDHLRLIELRGGCTCFNRAPCQQCSDPITEKEAALLGIDLQLVEEVVKVKWREFI